MTITVTVNYNGSLTLSTVHAGYLVSKTYYGYTRREARAAFRELLTQTKAQQ
jgi:hypothetical protein